MSHRNTVDVETDVLIIGAGAAGLMCAIEAGKRGRRVMVIEHAEKIGKKILISGGGRCNFTNVNATSRNYLSQNPHFCTSALARYTPHDFIALVDQHGIAYHEKKLGQLFCNDSSRQIVQMLEDECKQANVLIRTNTSIQSVKQHDDGSFLCESSLGRINAQSVVIATGGLPVPKMGATDFGLRIAAEFGLRIVSTKPALVPLTFAEVSNEAVFGEISGVSLDAVAECNGASFRENVLFTHRGLSGPAILQVSSFWHEKDVITLNTLPMLDFADIWNAHRSSSVIFKNVLANYLPKRFVDVFCTYHPALKDIAFTPFANLPRKGFDAAHAALVAWDITPNGTEGYAKAEVMVGGVSTDELSSKTMETKKIRGLYFIGEVVDVTGWLGGYNFQWAWSSGVAAGGVV